MKLFEALGISNSNKVIDRKRDDYLKHKIAAQHTKKSGSPYEKIGDGMYSDVYKHKEKPEVIKIGNSLSSDNKDAYLNYLDVVMKSDRMASNPYLPRVYKVKRYNQDLGHTDYVVKMEPLSPLLALEIEDLIAIWRKAFGQDSSPPTIGDPFELVHDLANMLSSYIYYRKPVDGMVKIVDKQLLQAIAIISNLRKRGGGVLDLHAENIMARRTSIGPQLVITDPLS